MCRTFIFLFELRSTLAMVPVVIRLGILSLAI